MDVVRWDAYVCCFGLLLDGRLASWLGEYCAYGDADAEPYFGSYSLRLVGSLDDYVGGVAVD